MKTLTKHTQVINPNSIDYPILKNSTNWISTETNHLSILESGPNGLLYHSILKAIQNATDMVCLQSFLIQDSEIIDALVEAVNERNVKVYVLSSAEARLKERFDEDEDFIKAKYIEMLEKKFKYNFLFRSAENFHAKYILIDPKSNPKGFLCTNNFTQKAFFENPELAVELSEKQIRELYKIFVYHFWEHAMYEQNHSNVFDIITPASKFELYNCKEVLLTSPNAKHNTLNSNLISAVKKAQKSISFSIYQIDINQELTKEIINKSNQGLDVTLYCRPNEKQFLSHVKHLIDNGINVFMHPLIHAKSLIIDECDGYIFTANYTENGLLKGLEVGVKLNSNQLNDLLLIHANWETTFSFTLKKSVEIKHLELYYEFQQNELKPITLTNSLIEKKHEINKVQDLLSLIKPQHIEFKKHVKLVNLKNEYIINSIPKKLNVPTLKPFELINVFKPIKTIIISKDFTLENTDLLKGLEDYKIYCQ